MKNNITITVSGTTLSGKSFIKHKIADYLKRLGLDVSVEENELNQDAVNDRINNPAKFALSLNEKKTKIKVTEQQLSRLYSK